MRGGNFACLQDSDCRAGANGRCVNLGVFAGCDCVYDVCTQDTDCPTGKTCACHGSLYNDLGNNCVPGNCRVDADCGPGNSCSPTAPASGFCGTVGGYYCHTPNDLCFDDSECPNGGGSGFCEYSSTNKRWECAIVTVCP